MSYISSGSYKINAKLRSGEELSEYEKRIVDGLDTALQKMPKYEGTVYRSLDSSMMGDVDDEILLRLIKRKKKYYLEETACFVLKE